MAEEAEQGRADRAATAPEFADITRTPQLSDSVIVYCKIFPPLGIARVGNSPQEYFIGPEAPGIVPDGGGMYKDAEGRVKRQAARFRIYAFNARHEVIAELNIDHPDVEDISW